MPLTRCGHGGRTKVIGADPPIETRRGALYVPALGDWAGSGWGLYDQGDRLIVSASDWIIGPSDEPVPASGRWTVPVETLDQAAGERAATFVYGGLLAADPTSLITGVLSRFWSRATGLGAQRPKLLFHAREDLDELFECPPVATVMGALGIVRSDCVTFDVPVRLECVIVPAPAYEPGRLAHHAYRRVAAALGINLAGRVVPADFGPAPVHISSALELTPAFSGEADFDRVLREAGVAVLHPSEMSLAALVTRVRSAPLLSASAPPGRAGLGCQAAVFRDAGARMVLCAGHAAAADTALIDALCGNDALYLHPVDPTIPDGLDAASLARGYLRAMRRLVSVRDLPCRLERGERRTDIARGARCTTADGQGGADSLVGGLLTGTAQLRVAGRQYPWWQADLGETCEIEEVCLHGPLSGDDRPTDLALFGSHDATDWTPLAECRVQTPIGGLDGEPRRFRAERSPWQARHLRIQSGTGVLALDQVEIFAPADRTPRHVVREDVLSA